jgi:hypothetical protein
MGWKLSTIIACCGSSCGLDPVYGEVAGQFGEPLVECGVRPIGSVKDAGQRNGELPGGSHTRHSVVNTERGGEGHLHPSALPSEFPATAIR